MFADKVKIHLFSTTPIHFSVKSFMISHSPEETQQFATILQPYIQNGGVVCLYGDLGTGKTLFTKALLKQFGLEENTVKSPTYTLFREHTAQNGMKIYHADFYRIDKVDEFTQEHIEEIFHKQGVLTIIEWAERIQLLLPLPRLDIKFEYAGKDQRKITVNYIREPLREVQIHELYERYHVPEHIRQHMAKVAEVAVSLANKINLKTPRTVDTVLLEQAAFLHDLVKVCDIKSEQLAEIKASEQDRACWKDLSEQYKNVDHAQAAAEILRSLGENFIATIIAKHAYSSIIDSDLSKRPCTWEEKLLYYADKRVKHDQFVSLKERLEDGRKRYSSNEKLPDNEEAIEKTLFSLEEEIYAKAQIRKF